MSPAASGETGWREHWRAAGSNAYFDDFAEPMLELAVAHLASGDAGGGRLLDVGCGYGRNAELFRRLGMQVTGIDLDEPALRQARKNIRRSTFRPATSRTWHFPTPLSTPSSPAACCNTSTGRWPSANAIAS